MVAGTVGYTVRLPVDLHKWLRRQAYARNTSIQALIVAAVEQAREQAKEAS